MATAAKWCPSAGDASSVNERPIQRDGIACVKVGDSFPHRLGRGASMHDGDDPRVFRDPIPEVVSFNSEGVSDAKMDSVLH